MLIAVGITMPFAQHDQAVFHLFLPWFLDPYPPQDKKPDKIWPGGQLGFQQPQEDLCGHAEPPQLPQPLLAFLLPAG
jgi:hypothetical protein